MHVFRHRDREGDLVHESLGEITAYDDPVAFPGELAVLLRKNGLADAAEPRHAEVALVLGEVAQVLPEAPELLLAVRQIRRRLPDTWTIWILGGQATSTPLSTRCHRIW